jgi:hypothetical protein
MYVVCVQDFAPENKICIKGEGQSRVDSCKRPCEASCLNAIESHVKIVRDGSGYIMDTKDKKKVLETCNSQCMTECAF